MHDDVFGIVGSVLAGAFEIEAVVAEGGYAVVYRAQHGGFRAPVALKCLKVPERLAPRQQRLFLDQFRVEAELMFRLSASTPNVVRPLHVDAFVTESGRFVPFIALEWLEGKTLDAMIVERSVANLPPIALEPLIQLLTPVARALERAHNFVGPEGAMSIVHRDLKPENIFVAEVAGEQVVKILDFGIAKAMSVASQAAGRVSSGPSGGDAFTPAYGAPEQWLPKRFGQAGPWTDVWGLALCMVEALVGHPVIEGDTTVMMATVLDPVRRPTPGTEGAAINDTAEAVFLRALALDPRKRYASVASFWEDLLHAAGMVPGTGVAAVGRPSMRARPASDPVEAVIPDLELDSAALLPVPSRVPESVSRASQSSVHELELEYDLAAAPIALELDTDELLDARRSSGRWSPSSAPRPSFPSGSLEPSMPSSPPRGTRVSYAPQASTPATPPRVSLRSAPGAELSLGAMPNVAVRASPFPRASSVHPAQPSGLGQAPEAAEQEQAPGTATSRREATLIQRVWPGATLLAGSVIVTLADQMYASHTGSVFSIGPIRVVWIAGLLMVAGLALLVYRLLPRRDRATPFR
jgi:serine/threonine-protein kinase